MRRRRHLILKSATIRHLNTAELPRAVGGQSLHCTEDGRSLCVFGCSGSPDCFARGSE
jgi:hypothetical protein